MWSGPRNISTAMMRAWGNRADTFVVDEPFYAFYLNATGKKHPGADEVIAHGETDRRKIVEQLTGDVSGGKRIYFQKQMTQDRKSTRLNSSHRCISYAVFCLKKKKKK